MAYDIQITGSFSSRPNYDIYLYVRRDQTDAANNRSSYAWELRARWLSGSPRAWETASTGWSVQVGSDVWYGSGVLDFRGADYLVLGASTSNWFGHDGNGNLNIGVAASMGPSGNFGNAGASATFATDRIGRVPGTPGTPSLSNYTTSSIRITSGQPSGNGDGIDTYRFHQSTKSDFSNGGSKDNSGYIYDYTGLTAGTLYYFRTQAHSAQGWGGLSPSKSAPTIPGAPSPTSFKAEDSDSAVYIFSKGTGNVTISSWEAQIATNSAFTTGLKTVTSDMSTTFTGLAAGTTYYVRSRGNNASGWGAYSGTLSTATYPSAPTNTSFVSTAPTTAVYKFSKGSGNAAVTDMQAQIATNSGFTSGLQTVTSDGDETFTGLTPGTMYYVRARSKTVAGWGSYSSTLSTPTLPGATTSTSLISYNPTSVDYVFTKGTTGNTTITSMQAQIATNSGFTTGVQTVTSDGTETFTGLAPGTTYYARSRANNASGWGAYSSPVISTRTMPSVPPGMTVTPSASGVSAVVSTPPGGLSGVTQYKIERRIGTGTATTYTTLTNSYTATGLVPGTVYQWRASAFFDAYQSPWTDWVSVTQPNPSTKPGDYFDGATKPSTDEVYSWTDVANLSTSVATGKTVKEWVLFTAGSTGATGVIARVSDPVSPGGQSFAARMTVWTSATSAGLAIGTNASATGGADVTAGGEYTGSIFVKPSRSQRLKARLRWVDAAGAGIGWTEGDHVIAPADAWTRLIVSGTAPANAEWAGVRVYDIEGEGWSPWLGGDTLTADGAMITLGTSAYNYFDGSYPDEPGYMYSWTGAENASPSVRDDVVVNLNDALIDPDCPPVPAPPRPPAIIAACLAETGVWRRYYATIPATDVPDWIDALPTFRLSTYGYAERQVRIRIYANPFGYPLEQIDVTSWCSEQIISYIPARTLMTLDGEIQRAFASVNGGPMSAADHLLYGTGGTPASWPVLTCGMSYLISFDTPVSGTAPPLGNVSISVDLTRRT